MPALFRMDGVAFALDAGASASIAWGGGVGTFAATGTIDSATLALQASYDNGTTWIPVGDDTTLAAVGHGNFDLPPDVLLRVNSSGGQGSVAMVLYILPRRPTS